LCDNTIWDQRRQANTVARDDSQAEQPTLVASLSALRIRREVLTTDEIHRRFPIFRVADGTIGLYQADAGILPASQCVRVMIDRALHHGAVVIEHAAVRSIRVDDDGADVQT